MRISYPTLAAAFLSVTALTGCKSTEEAYLQAEGMAVEATADFAESHQSATSTSSNADEIIAEMMAEATVTREKDLLKKTASEAPQLETEAEEEEITVSAERAATLEKVEQTKQEAKVLVDNQKDMTSEEKIQASELIAELPADAQMDYDLIEIYSLALQNSPEFRAAQERRDAAQMALPAAWAELIPRATFSWEHSGTNLNVIDSQNTVFAGGKADFAGWTRLWELEAPLIDFQRFVGVHQARASDKLAIAEYEETRQGLTVRIVQEYLAILAAEENKRLAEEELKSSTAQLEQVQGRYRSGLIGLNDVFETEARVAQLKAEMINTENMLLDSREALFVLTGVKDIPLRPVTRDIPIRTPQPNNVESWVQRSLQQNPSIIADGLELTVSEREIYRRYAAHMPNLSLTLQDSYEDTDDTIFGGGGKISEKKALLKFRVPLFDARVLPAGLEAQALRRAASSDLETTKRNVERDVRRYYNDVVTGADKLSALRKAVKFRSSALEENESAYASNLKDIVDVLDARSELYRAERDLIEGWLDYVYATLNLRAAAGVVSQEDIYWVTDLMAEIPVE